LFTAQLAGAAGDVRTAEEATRQRRGIDGAEARAERERERVVLHAEPAVEVAAADMPWS